jgi:hypothetical protein
MSRRSHRLRAALLGVGSALALALAACGGSGHSTDTRLLGPGDAPKTPPGEFGRNVARITGKSPSDVAGAAVLAAYPPQRNVAPSGWVLVSQRDWRQATLAAQFAAKPVAAGVLAIEREYLPTAAHDLLVRLHPHGFPRGQGVQAVVFGKAGDDVVLDLQDQDLKQAVLAGSNPSQLAADVVPFRGGWAGKFSDNILVVSSEARDYALPGAAWSAYSGDTIGFVTRRGVPAATARMLVQRQKLRLRKPTIYVLGPPGVIPDSVVGQLGAYGTVKRVGAQGAVENAIALAKYGDPSTGFGWGLSHGPASISLINRHDWGNAIGAFTLAATGPQAPLLLTDGPGPLPQPLVAYLRQLTEKEHAQGFVFGDEQSISHATLAQLDRELS